MTRTSEFSEIGGAEKTNQEILLCCFAVPFLRTRVEEVSSLETVLRSFRRYAWKTTLRRPVSFGFRELGACISRIDAKSTWQANSWYVSFVSVAYCLTYSYDLRSRSLKRYLHVNVSVVDRQYQILYWTSTGGSRELENVEINFAREIWMIIWILVNMENVCKNNDINYEINDEFAFLKNG